MLEDCCDAVRTVVGAYGTDHDNFPLGRIFDKGLKMWYGQAPVQNYIDELITLATSGKVRLDDVLTHTMPLEDAAKGYKMFNHKEDNCVKIIRKP